LDDFILRAISEDIGDGDHTSLACIPEHFHGKADLFVKQEGVLAGVAVALCVFQLIDSHLIYKVFLADGSIIKPGDVVLSLSGSRRSILKAERLVLNIMQRMSGIASQTALYVSQIKGTEAKILDTRKTSPNLRFLEKEAVKIGGGYNHRMGLFDMIMIKDNHIDFAGGIKNAIHRTLDYLEKTKRDLKIEIEARSLDEVKTILEVGGIHRIMLDNFTPEETSQAVKMINRKYETESSGGITLKTIREYAETGVDYISVGALTHQILSLDMSLKAV